MTGLDQAGRVEPGDVLVAPFTDAAWTPLFLVAGAVVVDLGAINSHAMVVARELGIPCVVSVPSAACGSPTAPWSPWTEPREPSPSWRSRGGRRARAVTTAPPPGPRGFDVVVLGTGAAGLVAALAADAGAPGSGYSRRPTRRRHGGDVGRWMLGAQQRADGRQLDRRQPGRGAEVLASLSFGHIRPGFGEAFVDDGPRVFGWLESAAGLRMKIVSGYPDYHPERPGGKPGGGRTVEPELFSFRRLGTGRIGRCPATAART